MAKTEHSKATYAAPERRRERRRAKVRPRAIPEEGNRRRGSGRRDSDDFWARVRRASTKR